MTPKERQEQREERYRNMTDEEFIRHFVADAVILTCCTENEFNDAEEWAEWCTEEHGEWYCGKSFYSLATDFKYYIEECITNAEKIIMELLLPF